MMSEWLYTVRGRFTPSTSPNWPGYLGFSGFTHVSEVVTLDQILCPDIIAELIDEDWNHNVDADFQLMLFRNLSYLMARQPMDPTRHQLLAVKKQPDDLENIPPGFKKCGFDLMDAELGNSTLTNCGPLPEAFDPSIVNNVGLISELGTALRVRDRMRTIAPQDPHLSACEVWIIARQFPEGLDPQPM